jgi:predicted protein tyrosine phosphatase
MPRKAADSGRFLRQAETFADSLLRRDAIGPMSEPPPTPRDGDRLNVLFVCSRNPWRSPTGEQVWRRHPRVNVRSAGTSAGARRVVSAAGLAWADVVLVMEDKHKSRPLADYRALLLHKPLHVLAIPDDDHCMDPNLVELPGDPVADLPGLAR